MSSDTPETLRKKKYPEISFFEILSNSDNRFFQNLSALREFNKFNIKASEPIRYSYLFDSQRKILSRWDPGFLPSPLDLFENL